MSAFLLIESRDPFEVQDVQRTHELAAGLVKTGAQVTLLLVENGVFGARESRLSGNLGALAQQGVSILADEFSLRERGITQQQLFGAVRPSTLDVVVDHLEAGHKVLWH